VVCDVIVKDVVDAVVDIDVVDTDDSDIEVVSVIVGRHERQHITTMEGSAQPPFANCTEQSPSRSMHSVAVDVEVSVVDVSDDVIDVAVSVVDVDVSVSVVNVVDGFAVAKPFWAATRNKRNMAERMRT
jgi:hypothetical protein